jgi:hypothetical protein
MEIHTAEPLVPESRPFEDEITVANLRTYESPKTDQIPAELIQAGVETCSEIHKLINSVLSKESYLISRRSPLYQFTRGAIKLTSNCQGITVINFIQNFMQYTSLKFKPICRRNYWRSSVWVST